MGILEIILLVLFVLVAFFLVLIVLIQDDQGDGLSGMFGGGSSTAFGSRAGNVLTKTTSILGTIFLVIAFSLAFLFKTPTTGDVAAAARAQGQTQGDWWTAKAPVTENPAEAPMTSVPAVPSTTVPVQSTTVPQSTTPVAPVPVNQLPAK